jgi:hypothetical protein
MSEELMTLDDFNGGTGLAIVTEVPVMSDGVSPYCYFLHPRQDKYIDTCNAIGNGKLPEGTQILVVGGQPINASPLKFMLLDKWFAQYWARVDNKNNVMQASLSEQRGEYKEHIDCVILVFHDAEDGSETLTPARFTFRGPKTPCIKQLHAAIQEASKPEWAQKSTAHAQAASVKQPFARVVGTISLGQPVQPKDDPNKQKTAYTVADCSVKPVSSADYSILKDAWVSKQFQDTLRECGIELNKRLEMVKSKVL